MDQRSPKLGEKGLIQSKKDSFQQGITGESERHKFAGDLQRREIVYGERLII